MEALPNKLKVYAPNATVKTEVLKALHGVMLFELRGSARECYVHGSMNRQAKRAVLSVMRGQRAREATHAASRRALHANS